MEFAPSRSSDRRVLTWTNNTHHADKNTPQYFPGRQPSLHRLSGPAPAEVQAVQVQSPAPPSVKSVMSVIFACTFFFSPRACAFMESTFIGRKNVHAKITDITDMTDACSPLLLLQPLISLDNWSASSMESEVSDHRRPRRQPAAESCGGALLASWHELLACSGVSPRLIARPYWRRCSAQVIGIAAAEAYVLASLGFVVVHLDILLTCTSAPPRCGRGC